MKGTHGTSFFIIIISSLLLGVTPIAAKGRARRAGSKMKATAEFARKGGVEN